MTATSRRRKTVTRRRTRAWYRACKAMCTAQRSCWAFRGRTVAALIWRLIEDQMFSVLFSLDEYFVYMLLSIHILLVVDKVQNRNSSVSFQKAISGSLHWVHSGPLATRKMEMEHLIEKHLKLQRAWIWQAQILVNAAIKTAVFRTSVVLPYSLKLERIIASTSSCWTTGSLDDNKRIMMTRDWWWHGNDFQTYMLKLSTDFIMLHANICLPCKWVCNTMRVYMSVWYRTIGKYLCITHVTVTTQLVNLLGYEILDTVTNTSVRQGSILVLHWVQYDE